MFYYMKAEDRQQLIKYKNIIRLIMKNDVIQMIKNIDMTDNVLVYTI